MMRVSTSALAAALLLALSAPSSSLAFAPTSFVVPSSNRPSSSSSSTLPLRHRSATSSLRMASPGQSSPSDPVDCIVIGGGISGSSLAHNLNRAGVDVLLTEARDYLGGNVKSHNDDGFIWEEGPNSFATQPSIVRIAYELGIDDQLVFADESLPPWVNHNGMLHPLPKGQGGKGPKGQLELVFGPNGVLKFALAGQLLSWPGKIRAGIGAFLGHFPEPEGKEETIREWVTRILGEEVFLRCIDPFVSGVYAGNPETLSMKAALPKIARIERYSYGIDWNKFGAIFYGGLARQVELTKERKADPPEPEWVEFEYGNPGSFRNGLATLPNAISEELGQPVGGEAKPDSKVRLEWKITRVEKGDDGMYTATYDTPSGEQTVRSRTIVSTAPAHALRDVLTPVMPESAVLLDKVRKEINRIGIYYPPVCAATVAYPKSSFKDVELPNGFGNLQDLPGFGSLNPRTEGVRTLGTLWSSSLFPGRCPSDYNLLLNYIGGSRDVGLAELSEEEIISEVDKGCRQVLLKDDAPAPKVVGLKIWPTAIPQYEIGHLDIIKELEEAEKKTPGLWVCGNYRSGVAFPDCVTFGYDKAKAVKKFLDENETVVAAAKTETVAAKAEAVVAGAVADAVAEQPVDISIPYDAAAKLAFEASDKSMAYGDFKTKYEADAVADIIAKQPVDISIPYDAPAKLAFEASDKSMAYADFKTKYESDAVADVTAKKEAAAAPAEKAAPKAAPKAAAPKVEAPKEEPKVDISIPYDAAAFQAFQASDKKMLYSAFKSKFEANAVADVIAKKA